MFETRTVACGSLAVLSLALTACGEERVFHYTDNVTVQYTEKEAVPSLKVQFMCEGAHPAEEDEKAKKAREDELPQTDLGKAWRARACELIDAFDAAGPVVTWPERKVSYSGLRLCQPQIRRVAKNLDDAYAQLGRVEINKGAGTKLWASGPDIDQARALDFNIRFANVNYHLKEETSAIITTFIEETEKGNAPDPGPAQATQKPEDNELAADYKKAVEGHDVPGILVKADGVSTLAYPILGGPDAPSAVHYLREANGKLLIATPMIDASSPAACIASLSMDK